MPVSVTSLFGEPQDFEAALRKDGIAKLLITSGGRFRARLTQIALQRMRLAAGEEDLPRVAHVIVPAGMVLVSLSSGGKASPVWEGIETRAGDIITLGPGQSAHVRTSGPSRWGVLLVPYDDLVQYGGALNETGLDIPPIARWRPSPARANHLRHLFQAAIRVAEGPTKVLGDKEAAHGLEQQLLDALIECLSEQPAEKEC